MDQSLFLSSFFQDNVLFKFRVLIQEATNMFELIDNS